jgi:hypothetical protein
MIVVCAGMYRACSTWQYDVAAHLVERHRRGLRLGYLGSGAFADWRAATPHAVRIWWVVKSHEGGPAYGAELADGRAVALYAHRDLRDVVYSMLRKRRQAFEAFVREGMIHQILANDRYWRARPGVLTQRYEAIVAAPARAVLELAGHLGIVIGPAEAERVAAEYSFESNRRRLDDLAARLTHEGVDLASPSNAQLYDTTTLLHWNHLHQGKVGGWRELAAPAERVVLDRLCGGWLAAHGYPADAEAPRWGDLPAAERRRWRAAIVRGWWACSLRCASLRYPHLSRVAKRLLGMEEPQAARPITLPGPHRAPAAPPLAPRDARLPS